MNKIFLVRFTNYYLAITSPKLVLNQCNSWLCRTSYRRHHSLPAPFLSPEDQQGLFVEMDASLPGFCELPRGEGNPGLLGWCSAVGGNSFPFFLPTPRGLVLNGKTSIYPCGNEKTRSFFFCLLKGLGQMGISLRKQDSKLGEVAIKLLHVTCVLGIHEEI